MKINRNKFGLVVLIVPLIVCTTLFVVLQVTSRNGDSADEVVFRECFGFGTKPYKIDLLEDATLFEKHTVYLASAFLLGRRPPTYCVAAVGGDDRVFELPEEFNTVVIRENLDVASPKEALLIAETYIWLASLPGVPIILEGHNQIPTGSGDDPEKYNTLITPPIVLAHNGMYSVEFYTWKQIGGLLEKWSLVVMQNGTVEAERYRIASSIGDVIGLP